MAPKKSKPLSSSSSSSSTVTTNINTNTSNRIGLVVNEEVFGGRSDHWAFLDEIEAPMWVDLTSEAKDTSHENDDEWFQISHRFHQCSSRQLISAFSHSGEVCTNSIFGIEEHSSPKLPSSVSRSRGKDYKSRQWAQSNCSFTTKQHPVKNISSKSSCVNSEYVQTTKPGSGNASSRTHAGSQADSVCDSNLMETAGPSKTNSSFGQSTSNSGAIVLKEGGKNSISTITSESSEQNQQKSLVVSTQINGHTSGLLSALRISLRKSCVTRPAARVEINRVRKSEGSKSSSSKSSVGSSSNPGYDGKNTTTRGTLYKDKTPDSRNVTRSSRAPENKVKGPTVSKAPAVQVQNIISKSRRRTETVVQKSVSQETSKAKVQHLSVRAKVLVPQGINGQDRLIASRSKDKVKVDDRRNRSAGSDKENALEIMAASRNSMTRGKVSGAITQVQKATKGSMPVKNDGGKPLGNKGNINLRSGAKKSANMVQKVHMR